MTQMQISTASLQLVPATVTALLAGAAYNPTADVVAMAFIPTSRTNQTPLAGDWNAASWLTSVSPYQCGCLVGPGGTITLAAGIYIVWVKITDSPEIPVLAAFTLEVF